MRTVPRSLAKGVPPIDPWQNRQLSELPLAKPGSLFESVPKELDREHQDGFEPQVMRWAATHALANAPAELRSEALRTLIGCCSGLPSAYRVEQAGIIVTAPLASVMMAGRYGL